VCLPISFLLFHSIMGHVLAPPSGIIILVMCMLIELSGII
jgi:hypothetical protein